jgi:pimeloyl-ACP methyl ester carboxylesterase
VELADVQSILVARGVERAVLVGTSRGGILAMLLAVARPGVMAGVILNDIGPVIEAQGLMRIKNYVGRLPQPRSFQEAATLLRRLFESQFPTLSEDDWMAFARRTFKETDGTLVPDYDVKLARALKDVRPERALPPLWRQFDALGRIPLMVVRGSNSDILSAATVAAMRVRRPDIELLEVPDQGHAPLLAEADVLGRIRQFVAGCPHPH